MSLVSHLLHAVLLLLNVTAAVCIARDDRLGHVVKILAMIPLSFLFGMTSHNWCLNYKWKKQ